MSAKLSKADKIRKQMGDLTGPDPTAKKMINGLTEGLSDNSIENSIRAAASENPNQNNFSARSGKLDLADLLPKTDKTKTLPIKLMPVLHTAAVVCAERKNMTLHDYVVRALAEKVQRDSNKES